MAHDVLRREPRAFVPVLHSASADRPDEADTIATAASVHAALRRLGYRSEIICLDNDVSAIGALARARPVVAFNLVEAVDGDAGRAHEATAELDRLGIAYTGGTTANLLDTRAKDEVKQRLLNAGLATPAWSTDGGTWVGGKIAASDRVIVKSVTEHASLGLDTGSVVAAGDTAGEIARREAAFGGRFFAEAYIDGREFNISLLGRTGGAVDVLPLAETTFDEFPADRPRVVCYEAKWQADSFAYNNTPRRFPAFAPGDPLCPAIRRLCRTVWQRFGLAGYCRIDFRIDDRGTPWIVDINVNPCLAEDAGFAAAAAEAGIGYEALVARVVDLARASCRVAA